LLFKGNSWAFHCWLWKLKELSISTPGFTQCINKELYAQNLPHLCPPMVHCNDNSKVCNFRASTSLLQSLLVLNIHSSYGKELWVWKDWSWDFNEITLYIQELDWFYSFSWPTFLILKKYNKSRLMRSPSCLCLHVYHPPTTTFEFLNQSLWNLAHVLWHLSPSQGRPSQICPLSNTNPAASHKASSPTAILTFSRCTLFSLTRPQKQFYCFKKKVGYQFLPELLVEYSRVRLWQAGAQSLWTFLP
jgi:hypothetical protein